MRLSGSFNEHWSHHVVLTEFLPHESLRRLKARGWERKLLGEPQNALAIVFSNPISVAFLLLYTAHIVQFRSRLETPHYLKTTKIFVLPPIRFPYRIPAQNFDQKLT